MHTPPTLNLSENGSQWGVADRWRLLKIRYPDREHIYQDMAQVNLDSQEAGHFKTYPLVSIGLGYDF